MQSHAQPHTEDPYPSSDGQPMAESTDQYDWIVKIKENLERLFAERSDVFIAGGLFWYPVPDRGKTKPSAPDVLVAFGRPKGRRDSYKQWEEDGIAPQVVFEIWSVSNRPGDIAAKLAFYEAHGAEEFYGYDPKTNRLDIWLRRTDSVGGGQRLTPQPHVGGWTSPRLGVRFAVTPTTLELYFPDGEPFLTTLELDRQRAQATAQAQQAVARAQTAEQRAQTAEQRAQTAEQCAQTAEQRAETAEQRAAQERLAAERERLAAERERRRAEHLAAKLRAMGLDPDDLGE